MYKIILLLYQPDAPSHERKTNGKGRTMDDDRNNRREKAEEHKTKVLGHVAEIAGPTYDAMLKKIPLTGDANEDAKKIRIYKAFFDFRTMLYDEILMKPSILS